MAATDVPAACPALYAAASTMPMGPNGRRVDKSNEPQSGQQLARGCAGVSVARSVCGCQRLPKTEEEEED